ncbi:MAG: hypothetical protein CMJ94_14300 [Planctomycetes bacterium]|nr:hypothetical protein [Planctomycetota bacterium]
MQRLALLALLLAPSCAIPGDAAWSDLHANAFGGVYNLTAGGQIDNISGSAGGLAASGDLNVRDETENTLRYGARFGFAPVEVFLSGFSHESTHGGTFTGSIGPLSGTSDARTVLDFDLQRVGVGFDVVNTPVARVGLIFGVDFFAFNDFSFTASQGALSRSYTIADNEDVPIPVVGVRGDVGLPLTGLRAGAEISGFQADVEDVDTEFLDLDLHLGWEPANNDWFELIVGYRMIEFQFDGEIDDTNIDGTIDLDGLYFAIGIVF